MTANLAAPTGVFDYTWGFDKLFTFTAIETQDGWRHDSYRNTRWMETCKY